MTRQKKNNDLSTDQELFAEFEILEAKIEEGIPSTRKIILADLEETLKSLRDLRELGIDNLGKAESEKLLLEKVQNRMQFLEELKNRGKKKQPAEVKPKGPRLDLDEELKQLRIDDKWYEYAGDKATFLLAMLLKGRGQRISGSKLEDSSAVIPRADKIIKRLPKAIQAIIDPRKGGPASGGYRIKPEYFK